MQVANTSVINTSLQHSPETCNEGYFFDENDTKLCRPTCGVVGYKSLGLIVVERIAICICFVASVVQLVVAVTVQRDTM